MATYDEAHSEIMRLTSERRYDVAIRKCEEHLQRWPASEHHRALHNLAYVKSVAGDLDGALQAITQAIMLAPKSRGHRYARAEWALELERMTKRFRMLTRFLKSRRLLALSHIGMRRS